MRLFLAIQLSPAVREALLTAQDALRRLFKITLLSASDTFIF